MKLKSIVSIYHKSLRNLRPNIVPKSRNKNEAITSINTAKLNHNLLRNLLK